MITVDYVFKKNLKGCYNLLTNLHLVLRQHFMIDFSVFIEGDLASNLDVIKKPHHRPNQKRQSCCAAACRVI